MFSTILKHEEITDRQTAAETAKRWGMTKRRVLQLCREGKVYAAKKVNGEWTIPTVAVRPTDRRRYRNAVIPKHLAMILSYADAAVRDVPPNQRGFSSDALNFFIRGSAFNLHTLETSPLNFSDVCEILEGRAVGGKELQEQIDVLYHQRAIRFIVQSVEDSRWLSMRLVEQLHSLLLCGKPNQFAKMRRRTRVKECVQRVRTRKEHPIWLATDFLVRFLLLDPYDEHVERTAYMVANFILMRHGYPPVLIYRAVFRWWHSNMRLFLLNPNASLIDEWEDYFELENDKERTPERPIASILARTPLDPTIFVSLFAKAIRRSCRLGLMRAIPTPSAKIEPDDFESEDCCETSTSW